MNNNTWTLLAILILMQIRPVTLLGQSGASQATIIQFLGDTYISKRALISTHTDAGNLNMMKDLLPFLNEADLNILNFEGAATHTRFPFFHKSFLLKMPLEIGELLKNSNIHVATLANNHSMDYGYQGLFDSINSLQKANIKTTGAGAVLADALKPLSVSVREGNICLLSFARILPEEFYATDHKAGVAYVPYESTAKIIKQCKNQNEFVFVSFHWGEELSNETKPYQKELAHLAIDAGADAVIGHHPHVLQEIEFYKNRPIFYSIGNFLFATQPLVARHEGLIVRFHINDNKLIFKTTIIPINVNNHEVKFSPKVIALNRRDPINYLKNSSGCVKLKHDWHEWSCQLNQEKVTIIEKEKSPKNL